MRVTIDIPDDLYAALEKRLQRGSEKPKPADVKKHMKGVLAEFGQLGGKNGRYFVVEGDQRRQLESVVQTTIETPDQLVRDVRKLNLIKVGEVERPLNDSEAAILQEQATFHGVSPEEFAKNTIDEALGQALGTW